MRDQQAAQDPPIAQIEQVQPGQMRRRGKINHADHVTMGNRPPVSIESGHCAWQHDRPITHFHRGKTLRREQSCGARNNGAQKVAPIECHLV
jgi:hypothetical protein